MDRAMERFGLADDREGALAALVPGSLEHDWLRCLHLQNLGRFDEVEALLPGWLERHGDGPQLRQIRDRQAVARFPEPQAREHLRRRLGVRFDHARRAERGEVVHPASVDLAPFALAELTRRLPRDAGLAEVTEAAEGWLMAQPLDAVQRRALLDRLQRPDHEGLVELVLADLQEPDSEGFGSLGAHRLLLDEQLDALIAARPELRRDRAMVSLRIQRLRPADLDGADLDARARYLEAVWGVVDGLDGPFLPLVAHVLYHRLAVSRARGDVDEALFQRYLALPHDRPRTRSDRRGEQPLAATDHRPVTGLPAVHDDGELVDDLLDHFLAARDHFEPYDRWLEAGWLRARFAAIQLTRNPGGDDRERFFRWLGGGDAYARLEQEVVIAWCPHDPEVVERGERVVLEADVKNVETLVLKVFRIEAQSYFARVGRDVDATIDLDGLVAGHEEVLRYDEPPLAKVRRRFELPALDAPGVYVVELIGNGRASRALMRKGRLDALAIPGPHGLEIAAVDEAGERALDLRVWHGGTEHAAADDGWAVVPWSRAATATEVLLVAGGVAQPFSVELPEEHYVLEAGFYVAREALVAGHRASVVVRPHLTVAGRPLSLEELSDVVLRVSARTHEGVEAVSEGPLELRDGHLAEHAFTVPEGLQRLSFELRARLRRTADQRPIAVARRETLSVQGIDSVPHTEQVFFEARADGGWLRVLGKNGEPRRGVVITVRVKHRFGYPWFETRLQTDEEGAVGLGSLDDVDRIAVVLPSGGQQTFAVPRDHDEVPAVVFLREGDDLEALPTPRASLLEVASVGFSRDRSDHLVQEGATLGVRDLPAGRYMLWLDDQPHEIHVAPAVAPGLLRGAGFVFEDSALPPPPIGDASWGPEGLVVEARGADVRVQIFGLRFVPEESPAEALSGRPPPARRRRQGVRRCDYLSGRDIGDEARYVLERRYAEVFPGNLLPRPSLLLNPYPVRATTTAVERAAAGEGYGAVGATSAMAMDELMADEAFAEGFAEEASFPSFAFLAAPAWQRLDLRPDGEGRLVVPQESLGDAQLLYVVGVAPGRTGGRVVRGAPRPLARRDRRWRPASDGAPQAQHQRVRVLSPGQTLELPAGPCAAYGSLGRVYQLLAALVDDATVRIFRFLVEWPALSEEARMDRYHEHACHELHVFLFEHDRAYFDRVVAPLLRHKHHPTFLDRYLLGGDLSPYLEPWRLGRLNVFERVVLARRTGDGALRARLREEGEALVPRPRLDERLFRAALGSGALDEPPPPPAPPPPAGPAAPRGGGPPVPMAAAMAPPPARVARRRARRRDAAPAPAPSFRGPEATQELAESNYHRLGVGEAGPDRVVMSPFWRDYAEADPEAPFLSPYVAHATRNQTELILALAALDLPIDAPPIEVRATEGGQRVHASHGGLVFHGETRPARREEGGDTSVLVTQRLFRLDDRFRHEGGEQVDKPVEGELLTGVVYVAQVALTNTGSSRAKVDVLLEIPEGAIAVRDGLTRRSHHLWLEPLSTVTREYAFYFPEPGRFLHAPAHVTRGGMAVASAEARRWSVVAEPTETDEGSWPWIAHHGSADDVLTYLAGANLEQVPIEELAWRLADDGFYRRVTTALEGRRAYRDVVWSYALLHGDVDRAGTYLAHRDDFVRGLGPGLQTPTLTIDPVERGRYEHLEYLPLVHARAHRLGAERRILNDRLRQQWRSFLERACCRAALDDAMRLELVYYLFLQDRVEEALAELDRVDREQVADRLQHDYLACYAAFYREDRARARALATPHAEHPVLRWRRRFAEVLAQLDEVTGVVAMGDAAERDRRQADRTAREPSLSLEIEGGAMVIASRNLERCEVSFYDVDVELAFSREPFAAMGREGGEGSRFAFIAPGSRRTVPLAEAITRVSIPEDRRGRDQVIAVSAGGLRRERTVYAHDLEVHVVERYGQLRVRRRSTDEPLPRAYVKVYARGTHGAVRFYKDGYTDLRGAFDYASLSNDDLEGVETFALLVSSREAGVQVCQAPPPPR